MKCNTLCGFISCDHVENGHCYCPECGERVCEYTGVNVKCVEVVK